MALKCKRSNKALADGLSAARIEGSRPVRNRRQQDFRPAPPACGGATPPHRPGRRQIATKSPATF